jgi:DNA modification methylase
MKPFYERAGITLFHGDALETLRELPEQSLHCCVTSPPYWGLRDYGVAGQLGLERTPEEYIANMVQVFHEVKRVLRDDGTLWLNMGDSYAGGGNYRGVNSLETLTVKQQSNRGARGLCQELGGKVPNGCKPKDLVGIPWMLAFALRTDGWYLRSDIIWSKPNPMPESVTDRPTKAHEYIFLLSKSEKYFYDAEAIAEPLAVSSIERLSQATLLQQKGSLRVPGKTNGPMKAVGTPRQDGDRWNVNGAGFLGEGDCNGTRNKRSVWEVVTQSFSEAHFATFPEELIKPCILAGCPAGGIVLDPFMGSGTTGLVARHLNCKAIGIELNEEYIRIAMKRLRQDVLEFA